MKKIPKNVQRIVSQSTKQQNLIEHLGKFFIRGLLAGIFFQGSFLALGFQKRIVRGVTSTQLDQIRTMEKQTSEIIERNERRQNKERPNIPLEYLHQKYRQLFEQKVNKNQ